ncbi:MAG: DUF1592 domain-containing protein [Verrucomicrobiales bacterium]|nr:DUF1592 domain-containing protein [Verrucomicrobiales bacterium]
MQIRWHRTLRRTAARVGVGILCFFPHPLLQAGFEEGYEEIKPILQAYCNDCHNEEKHKGSLNLESYKTEMDILVDLQKWFSVIDQLETGVMPPEDEELQPTADEIVKLTSWIRRTIDEFDYESVKDPGKYHLRRLNKAEYNNTIRDLTGVDLNPAQYFSGDGGGGEGFDNNAEGMTMPPLMVEKYFKAARDISRHAEVSYTRGITFGSDPSPTHPPRAYLVQAERELTNFYNDFFEKLPKYNPRKEFEPYLMPAMKLALKNPEASDREIYEVAIREKLRPGVFYKWAIAFLHADEDIKTSRWDSHYGHWVLDPWLELQSRREKVIDSELQAFHDDFSAKVLLSAPATAHTNKPSMEVKTDLREGAEILYLSVGDMDDGHEFDHVVLHDPKVTLKDGSVVYLGDLGLIKKQGEGAIHRDKFPDGAEFVSTAAKKIERGFYVEAPALLSFSLPPDAKSFHATMGLEKSAGDKGSVQVYASDEEIPFPTGKHTHSHFYRGPGNYAVEEAKKWWVIYSSLVGYGKAPGAREMIDVSLSEEDKPRLEAIKREIEYTKRTPIKKFFDFVAKKKSGLLPKTNKEELPSLSDLAKKDRAAPAELSEADRKQWNDLRTAAEAVQAEMDGRVKGALLAFAARAFRRPLSEEDTGIITGIYDQSMAETDDFQKAAQLTLQSLFTRPQFLFRVEDEAPGSGSRPVDDYSMASRLSYFLWSSMPDETLLQLAKEGRLQDEIVLEEQVRRMLKDPRSISLAEEFASQWLGFRKILYEKKPDANLFPAYTPELEQSLYREAVMAFDDIVKQDKSVLEILDSKTTFLNEALAEHYDIPGIKGDEMRKVELTTDQRGGFPAMGSVLVATSYPGRTSPVIRGQWVLDALIGSKVPPPPEGVEIDESKLSDQSMSKKERLAAHSDNPNCMVCHDRLDPFGFTLENYDAIGRYRNEEGGIPVDAIGELKGGPDLSGLAGLKHYLMTTKRDAFLHQMAQKSLGFALGRSLEYYDESIIRTTVADLKESDYRYSALATAIVKSYPFRYRREKGYLTDAK